MTRLTKKNNKLGSWTQLVDDYLPAHNIKHKQCVNKLGQLENIEEELCIDLIKLFEILKSENIYANGKRYDNSNSLSYMGNSWLIFNHQAKQGFRFKDYGKTWALTKEELE